MTTLQKATKTLATRNAKSLNRTHALALLFHACWWAAFFLRFRRQLLLYLVLALPSVLIQIFFERSSRPTWQASSVGAREVKSAGEDLEQKGLTEWMWDVLYWTWGCLVLVSILGDKAWWAWSIIPAYSIYLAVCLYSGTRQGFTSSTGSMEATDATGGISKRQAKAEKRGSRQVYSYR